jgi:hypothetical protein
MSIYYVCTYIAQTIHDAQIVGTHVTIPQNIHKHIKLKHLSTFANDRILYL